MNHWNVWLLRNEKWLAWAVGVAPLLLWLLLRLAARGPRLHGAWVLLPMVGVLLLKGWCRWQRERAVREAPLPVLLQRKLREHYPHLSAKDADLVTRGLRQFFWACLRANGKFVAMPSRVVDVMWHEFILHTRAYHAWCDLTVGRYLHHTPAEVLGANARHNDGLRRAWFWACKDEGVNPRVPTRLPLLFALDTKFEIANGFRYRPDCADMRNKSDAGGSDGMIYCGGTFSDGSYSSESADAGDFGGADGGGDGGADGGGCGGD